ncbi:MAG: uracil-DNA glycosylase [Alphaproteobacteria bacterium]|nr:uracil-DNA glycosylase [Alphaproteobacteria bacterium]
MENALDIKSLLEWYILAGVDETCGDECYQAQSSEVLPASPLRQATTSLSQNVIASKQNARDLCAKATTLSELKQVVENFDGCALKLTAKSTVFGDGNEHAKIMFIGEAPGADEDRIGLPFVGRSGRLLEKMLSAINLKRADVYIANVVMWRPPGNRTPTDAEVAVCLPFLKRQIELISPEIIVFLGGSAANALLDNADSISRLRGRWLEYQTSLKTFIPALATFHPAYLLRNCPQKAKVWSDFLRILKKLKEN